MQTFTLDNGLLKAVFISFGATLHQLWVKNKKGKLINVIRGLDNPKEYLLDIWSRGAIIGRYAGRLENPIQIGSKRITIENEKGVLLHSGTMGWNKKYWEVLDPIKFNCIQFQYFCPDGAGGFPGVVKSKVTYSLNKNKLCLSYSSTTNLPTHVNLTNHAYFNLNESSSIDEHLLQVKADQFLELKDNLVPSGKLLKVDNTELDFRKKKLIGKTRLDDYFVLNLAKGAVASLYSPTSGIEMKTYTNQPGVVLFTPPHFEAICFETQRFSNSPNISHFPSTLLKPGEIYDHKTEYEFTIKS